MTAKQKLSLAVAAALNAGGYAHFAMATDIYTETWGTNTPTASPYTTTSTTANGGASVVSGILTLGNTINGATGATGNVRVSTPTSGAGSIYDPSWNTSLDSNGDSNLIT